MRHGQPEEHIQGRCYGNLDVNLSECGERQVVEKLKLLRSLAPRIIYTSPAKRASASARRVAGELKLPIQMADDLREINFGAFEGLTFDEIQRKYPAEYTFWMENPTEIRFPGGEGFDDLRTRVHAFLTGMLEIHRAQTVLAVAHAGVNRVILAKALGLPASNIFRIDQSHAGISIVDYFESTTLVRLVNG
jgi:alpha-ribazole phosphatase/probable phosphoglycerate mutase